MSDDTYKSREKIRNWAVAVVAAASLALGIFNFVDNRLARRDAERPYLGMDNVTVDQDSIGISAGGTIPKGRLFVQPGAIHATFRVYGTSLAIIRSYKMDCSSWPFTGGEDSRPNLTLPPGATKVFTCAPNITTPDQYAQLEDPTETRRIELTKAIDFKLNIVYEDMFHRIETKDFCFSNAPDWDHTHLRSCEEEPAKTK
jgi:hypothetical protein